MDNENKTPLDGLFVLERKMVKYVHDRERVTWEYLARMRDSMKTLRLQVDFLSDAVAELERKVKEDE